VQLAAFFDCGKAWDSGFSSQPFRKDAGLGLRFLFDTIGFLEKTVLRVDAARPVNDHSDHEWRFWFELSQPF
jgi:outer membrane translocation and assembly module TamA